MYSVVKESLQYVKEVVLFMNFEIGDHVVPKGKGKDESSFEVPERK